MLSSVYNDVFFVPIVLLPAPGIYCLGVLCTAGINPHILLVSLHGFLLLFTLARWTHDIEAEIWKRAGRYSFISGRLHSAPLPSGRIDCRVQFLPSSDRNSSAKSASNRWSNIHEALRGPRPSKWGLQRKSAVIQVLYVMAHGAIGTCYAAYPFEEEMNLVCISKVLTKRWPCQSPFAYFLFRVATMSRGFWDEGLTLFTWQDQMFEYGARVWLGWAGDFDHCQIWLQLLLFGFLVIVSFYTHMFSVINAAVKRIHILSSCSVIHF